MISRLVFLPSWVSRTNPVRVGGCGNLSVISTCSTHVKQKPVRVAKETLCRISICDLYGHEENAFP